METSRGPRPVTTADQPASFDVLRDLLVQNHGVVLEAIKPEATLESLGIDSLAVVDLLFQVEMRLQITFPDLDSRTPVTTMGEFAKLLDDMRAAAATPQIT